MIGPLTQTLTGIKDERLKETHFTQRMAYVFSASIPFYQGPSWVSLKDQHK